MKRGKASQPSKRVLVLGASGTIGQAVMRALVEAEFTTVGMMRRSSSNEALAETLERDGCSVHFGLVTDRAAIADAMTAAKPDTVISCLASRSGAPEDAQRIDFQANLDALDEAVANEVRHFILLSAICVQKPRLAFQHAKLRFERRLQVSGLTWSIVRPTAFFKSLSGQVKQVRAGKSFLLFGDGELTRCKPISDADLARYIVRCLDDPAKQNAILPIGGPGPSISPREQGEMLFKLVGKPPRYKSVPVGMFSFFSGILAPFAKLSSWVAEKREYARIARYYATESMLAWDAEAGAYSESLTPEFGSETLEIHYRALLKL
ncbi:NAD(P)H-binding protein [Altererythrobacter lutimaris]|uniref:Divinyl chlorophyllide a 8-vinyl-reductase, chloroplastic n=1 Tax=Altererythrobacter lutimaris TaxID=2743979 RepID=A0A850H833_9SPHN|nr:NAD(P)H-binding protein [Altererythrobacter lutimaris]NVE93690.1 NAD(P)H-binding protein [Altererythrobacter lutimaris]